MLSLIILLDLDDTCIPNAYRYHEASWRCGLIIQRALGESSFHPRTVIERHGDIDVTMVEKSGFQVDRFPSSWVSLYEKLCEEVGKWPNESVKRKLFNTASRFKYGPFRPFSGTKSVLHSLGMDGHQLHMITAGDDVLQNRKIDQAGLRKFFDSIHVTLFQKGKIMKKLVGSYPERAVMVGDSRRTDIRPAKALGITTVWIPSHSWILDEYPVEPDHTISSIRDLPEIIKKITKKTR